jgi:hypothetical protein
MPEESVPDDAYNTVTKLHLYPKMPFEHTIDINNHKTLKNSHILAHCIPLLLLLYSYTNKLTSYVELLYYILRKTIHIRMLGEKPCLLCFRMCLIL